jgi:Spy/CpxP family protein refolding chaperone
LPEWDAHRVQEENVIMFGFLIGTACLLGLISIARRHHHGYGYGGGCSGGGYGGGPWGRRGGGRWGRGGFGPRIFLRGVMERLDTTPGQEKVILSAVDELREAFHKAKEDFRGTRSDFANIVRGPTVDESTMSDIFMKHDTTISETRRAAVEAVRKIHEALTEKQRQQVADFLDKGPRGFGRGEGWGGGPYRSQWA